MIRLIRQITSLTILLLSFYLFFQFHHLKKQNLKSVEESASTLSYQFKNRRRGCLFRVRSHLRKLFCYVLVSLFQLVPSPLKQLKVLKKLKTLRTIYKLKTWAWLCCPSMKSSTKIIFMFLFFFHLHFVPASSRSSVP